MPSDPLLAHSQRLDREEMLAVIRLLERRLTVLEKSIDVLVATLSEVELRGLFVMDTMQMQVKANSGIIVSGQPQVVKQTMLQLYEQQREVFAQELMRREQAQAQAMAQADEGTKDGENPQAGEAGTVTASTPSVFPNERAARAANVVPIGSAAIAKS